MSETAQIAGSDILTLSEAAAHLRVQDADLTALAERGGVPARKIGQEWRFSKGALDEWMRHGSMGLPPRWVTDSRLTDGLLAFLEDRLLSRLKPEAPPAPRRGSKQAVLQHIGQCGDDEDLEQRLEEVRKRRGGDE